MVADFIALDPAIEAHICAMLRLGLAKHQAASNLLAGPRPKATETLRQVLALLEDVDLLVSDAASYVDSAMLKAALAELHRRQKDLRHRLHASAPNPVLIAGG
ncbi:MAG: hypothetical protein ACKOXK_11680 [Chakrabartia sp.]